MNLTDGTQGARNDQRLGRQIYLHGIRFNIFIKTVISAADDSWQNGHMHFALCQANDDSLLAANKKPSFSTPIGDVGNDQRDFAYIDDAASGQTVWLQDLRNGKLKNDEYKVITHRKYYIGKSSTFSNEQVACQRQFYIPIKKNIQFETNTDVIGMKPFFIMFWWVPSNEYMQPTASDRYISVWCRHATYFKTHT